MKRAEFPIFKTFMDFLDNEVLNNTLAGYWCGVLTSLYTRFSDKCAEFFCNFPDYLSKLIKHLYSTAIADFVQKLLVDEGNQINIRIIGAYRKLKADMVNNIINLLGCSNKDHVANAYQLLFNCIEYRCAIVDIISSELSIKLLYGIASQKIDSCKTSEISRTSLRSCLGILKQILDFSNKPAPVLMMDSPKKTEESVNISPIITEVTKIKEMLEVSKIRVANEVELQGFKTLRIVIVEFVNALLLTNNPGVTKMLFDIKIYHEFLQYFIIFPECSILLNAVVEGLSYLCKNSTNSELIRSVLEGETMQQIIGSICNSKQINHTIYCFQYELLKLLLDSNIKIGIDLPNQVKEEYNKHKSTIALEIGSGIYKNTHALIEPQPTKTEDASPPRVDPIEVRVEIDSPFDDDKEVVMVSEPISELKEIEKLDDKPNPHTPLNIPVEYYYQPTFPNLPNDCSQLPQYISSATHLGTGN